MTVIFKVQGVKDLIESLNNSLATKGTQKHLHSAMCKYCFIIFETQKLYKRDFCYICQYERTKLKDDFFQRYKHYEGEKDLYEKVIAKGIYLHNRKTRMMKAKNCTIKNRKISRRLEGLEDHLET